MKVTRIDIGPQHTEIGTADGGLVLALGSAATADAYFHHAPPTPTELERAIDAVEDEVMRARTLIRDGSVLVASGSSMSEVASAVGALGAAEAVTLDAVEQLFQRLASASLGQPIARRGLPESNQFAATVLILREFMHHLGFASVSFAAASRSTGQREPPAVSS